MSLSSSIDRAVKAYIEHTNVVLSSDASLASLDISMLQQPFYDLAAPQLAQLALAHQQNDAHGSAPAEVDGKRKRTYKPRDPNAPKRPLTAYFRYLQEQRGPFAEQMAKDNEAGGTGKPGDISKAVTENWKKMTEAEQLPYKEAYQRALKDYEKEVAAYKATGGAAVEEDADAEAEVESEPQVNGAAEKEDDAEESDSESESSTDEEEAVVMPPPPPKVASPEVKKTPKTPKSAMKKTKAKAADDVPATPQFSSINPGTAIPSSQQRKSSSPELKRKATADVAGDETTKKKRGRKTNKQKEAEAAEAEAAAAQAVTASDASEEKPKKEKKKKRKSEAAA
jgi:hypothetical protein